MTTKNVGSYRVGDKARVLVNAGADYFKAKMLEGTITRRIGDLTYEVELPGGELRLYALDGLNPERGQ